MKPTKETLENLYVTERLATRAIAALYSVKHISVRRWLISYGIPARPTGRGLAHRGMVAPTKDELHRMVHIEHRPYREIAALYGVDFTAIPHWMKKHGVPTLTRAESRRKGVILPDGATLESQYTSGLSLATIADIHGIGQGIIKRLCRQYGITLRLDGWNGGQRMACNDGHLVRSSYELRVDNWLSEHQIAHFYEPVLPFDRRFHADFLANGWYLEIWGVKNSARYTARKERKLRMYHAQHAALIEIPLWEFDTAHEGLWIRRLESCLIPQTDPSVLLPMLVLPLPQLA